MSTTRHHINRQRRLASVRTAEPTDPAPKKSATATATAPTRPTPKQSTSPSPKRNSQPGQKPSPKPSAGDGEKGGPRPVLLAALCVLVLALGAFAGLAHTKASDLRDDPAARNTALTDTARTSELKGRVNDLVGALFSYDYADAAKSQKAADSLLTGKAVGEHRDLLADIRAQAKKQKLVIRTTVTDSAVERITGDRARVLVYADQSSVSAAAASDAKKKAGQDEATYAGAMFALDLVDRDGHWLVSGIDTFTS